jgi:hypothetical protein
MEPEFIIADDYPCLNDWTPDELAKAAVVPLRKLGIRLIRKNAGSENGLQQGDLSQRDYIAKKYQTDRIIAEIQERAPPGPTTKPA